MAPVESREETNVELDALFRPVHLVESEFWFAGSSSLSQTISGSDISSMSSDSIRSLDSKLKKSQRSQVKSIREHTWNILD